MLKIKQNSMRVLMGFSAFCLVLSLGACVHNEEKLQNPLNTKGTYLVSLNLEDALPEDLNVDQHTLEGIEFMRNGQLQKATEKFNTALSLNFTSSSLQLLNGINYHLRAISGDGGLFPMAEQGYLAAIRFDKSNWAARYYLGLFYIDSKRYLDAQRHFAVYVINNDADPEGLYYLALSSYYSADPVTAHAAAMRLVSLIEDLKSSPIDATEMLRLLAMTKAAVNKPEEADSLINEYLNQGGEVDHAAVLHKRLDDWRYVYANADVTKDKPAEEEIEAAAELAAAEGTLDSATDESDGMSAMEDADGMDESDDMMGMDDSDEDADSESENETNDAEFVEGQMVAVDVVIIRSEETVTESNGINLLNGLQLQFGSIANGLDAFSAGEARLRDILDPTQSTSTKAITKLISVPAVAYTLNILNEQGGLSEVLARPTLVARAGQTSEFFSGVEISAAAVSGGAGDSVSIEKEIGLKLAITPEIGPDNIVFLHVIAERTFLTQPSSSVVFEFRLDTTKTLVDANVAMQFGQTLILSGLDERSTESNLDGVPGLRKVPLINRFFSQENTSTIKRSVVILLTPRPASYLYAKPGAGLTTVADLNSRPTVEQLSERYESWFQPNSNAQNILNNLSSGELYKYFQSRDIPADAWYKSTSHSDRLREIFKKISI